IIILDINLPGMSGFDALKKLSKFKETSNIPIMALSAAATRNDINKGMKAGFRDYLTKPIDIPVVVNAIKAVLEDAP
ncbi:MAG: response regulator transcription factor, partial [Rhodospirillales bacterium]|nr:response regulator transcription factor [Rhodospirillales bacterium]